MTTAQPEHLEHPHLRPIQPIPVTQESTQLILLRDPLMLAEQATAVPPPAMQALQLCDGQHSIDSIASGVQQNRDVIEKLILQLDSHGLLWGPGFKELETKKMQTLKDAGAFPVRGTTPMGTDVDAIQKQFALWLDETEDPEIDFEPTMLFLPQLEYPHTWPIFAACWHALQSAPAPDRIIVFSNNAHGIGDGIVLTRLGFETPLGRMQPDTELIESLAAACGERVFADELDHIANIGIEMQLPWIQQRWGDVPVTGVLVPDPIDGLIESDELRIDRPAFTGMLRDCLATLGGRTLFIASGDLSHVGPQYGEPRPIDDQRRFDVERNDRDLLGHIMSGDVEAFLSAISWTKNPTRWSGAGVLAALLETCRPQQVELIDYRQATNPQNTALVSCGGLAMA
ncbi:MAG: AmmeMemoRadiSam system protein B [Phycisphaerales bacterium]|nr:AmmeMemoRadiSam system protein B [Phycisphaerales bacterium]